MTCRTCNCLTIVLCVLLPGNAHPAVLNRAQFVTQRPAARAQSSSSRNLYEPGALATCLTGRERMIGRRATVPRPDFADTPLSMHPPPHSNRSIIGYHRASDLSRCYRTSTGNHRAQGSKTRATASSLPQTIAASCQAATVEHGGIAHLAGFFASGELDYKGCAARAVSVPTTDEPH